MDNRTYTYSDGSTYEGDMKNGKRHGRGVFVKSDGMRYEGEWKEDKPEGYGILTAPNGTVREGYWKKGKLVEQEQKQEIEERVKQLEKDVHYLKQELKGLKVQQPNDSILFKEEREKDLNQQDKDDIKSKALSFMSRYSLFILIASVLLFVISIASISALPNPSTLTPFHVQAEYYTPYRIYSTLRFISIIAILVSAFFFVQGYMKDMDHGRKNN